MFARDPKFTHDQKVKRRFLAQWNLNIIKHIKGADELPEVASPKRLHSGYFHYKPEAGKFDNFTQLVMTGYTDEGAEVGRTTVTGEVFAYFTEHKLLHTSSGLYHLIDPVSELTARHIPRAIGWKEALATMDETQKYLEDLVLEEA